MLSDDVPDRTRSQTAGDTHLVPNACQELQSA